MKFTQFNHMLRRRVNVSDQVTPNLHLYVATPFPGDRLSESKQSKEPGQGGTMTSSSYGLSTSKPDVASRSYPVHFTERASARGCHRAHQRQNHH